MRLCRCSAGLDGRQVSDLRTFSAKKRRTVSGLLMVLPLLLLYGTVVVYPLLNMVYTSFFSWSGIAGVELQFAGLSNYIKFWTAPETRTAFLNIGILALTGLFATLPISFFLATVINRRFFGLRIVKTMYFLPVVINRMAICLMFTFLLLPSAGPIPSILEKLGLAEHLNLLGNVNTAMWTVAFVNMWSNVGFQMILFSSGMASIPEELYEAAALDGVTPWQRLRYITLPQLRPMLSIVIIFILTGTFKVFDFVIGLTGGGPAYATEVPITLLYKQAFTYGKFGYANAISVMMVLLCLLIALLVNHIFAEHELPGRRKHLP